MEKYGQGTYRIIRDNGGWCVARLTGSGRWRRVSDLYVYRGWAVAYARRTALSVQNA